MTALRLPFEAQRESQRRLSNKDKVLARLRTGPATTMQLIEVGGTNATARVRELRKEGYSIPVDDKGAGLCVYRLVQP